MVKIKEFVLSLILGFFFLFALVYADSNGVWHNAEDVKVGTFGTDEGNSVTSYIFVNPVSVQDINVSGTLKVNTIKPNSGSNVVIQLG